MQAITEKTEQASAQPAQEPYVLVLQRLEKGYAYDVATGAGFYTEKAAMDAAVDYEKRWLKEWAGDHKLVNMRVRVVTKQRATGLTLKIGTHVDV